MAPINDRLSREQCEKAVAAYIIQNKPGSALAADAPSNRPDAPIHVRKGKLDDDGHFTLQNLDEIPVPSVTVSCPRTKPHDMGYPVCELHIMCLTSTDEKDAAARAAARFGFIAELLDESHDTAVRTAMNAPPSGTDARDVKDFNVFGFYLTEDLGQETDRHWIDHLVYEFHCIPTDDTDGDGNV